MISTATKSSVKKNGVIPFPLERVVPQALNQARMISFQNAINDFLEHSKETRANLAQIWNWVFISILRQTPDEIWWALSGDDVLCYFVNTPQQDWTGKWGLFINHGWAHKSIGSHGKRSYLKVVEEDAFNRGVERISFLTQRTPVVFQKFLGKDWKPNGVLFERVKNWEATYG